MEISQTETNISIPATPATPSSPPASAADTNQSESVDVPTPSAEPNKGLQVDYYA